MTTFTGTAGVDTADATVPSISGFTGGGTTELTDGTGDTFNCLGGNDTVHAGTGNDTLNGGAGADTLDGGGGSDTYEFNSGDLAAGEVISDSGGSGTDTLKILATVNFNGVTISGIEALLFTGNQGLLDLAGAFLPSDFAVTGADGTDQTIFLTAGSNNFTAAGWTFTSWEASDQLFIAGGNLAQTLIGSSQSDIISGTGGADTLDGRGGSDQYNFGFESLSGLVINDTGASGIDTLLLGGANLTVDFSVASTIAGIEAIDLPQNNDVAIFNASQFSGGQLPSDFAVTGADGAAQTITIQNAGNFSAAAWSFAEWESGNDIFAITGTAAGDNITGSSQNDKLTGAAGNDSLDGGAGSNDIAIFAGTANTYTVKRVDGATTSWVVADTDAGTDGDDGADTLSNIEKLNFAASATTLMVANLVGALSDSDVAANSVAEDAANGAVVGITGLAVDGNGDGISYSLADDAGGRFEIDASGVVKVLDASLLDFEVAASHNIIVRATSADGSFTDKQFTVGIDFVPVNGTTGPDALVGTDKRDVITGLAGKDVLTGGLGADTFNFDLKSDSPKGAGRDVITDFVHLTDHIDLATIDAKKGTGNQAFHFISKQPFHHKAGELHYIKQNLAGTAHDKTIVEGDINGDGRADFQIELSGLHTLSGGDFIF